MIVQAAPPSADIMPTEIPIFPLSGVLLLPRGQLPLNIFEPRYLAMVDDALKSHRLIGIIQPRSTPENLNGDTDPLYNTGCAGRITSFSETGDGRYIITLTGICRFNVAEELSIFNGYRRVRTHWECFAKDFEHKECLDIDRPALKKMLHGYFQRQGFSCDWAKIDGSNDASLITCLAMICPFDAGEKQILLETVCCRERARKFMSLLEIALHDDTGCCGGKCH